MKPIVLMCALLSFTANAATEKAPTHLYEVVDGSPPSQQAAQSGDRAALAELAKVPLAGMDAMNKSLLSRLDGDFDGSAQIARRCVDESVRGTYAAQIGVVCAMIAASDLFMRGDLRGWARSTHADWSKLRAPLEKAVEQDGLTTSTVLSAEDVMRSIGKEKTSFAVNKQMDRLDFLPATKPRTGKGDDLFVPAKVDGKPVNMRFDTGAQITVLSRVDANRLGLKVESVKLGVDGQASTASERSGMVNIGQLQVGNLVVRNTSVLVVDFPESILGIDLIGRMADRVAISKRGLRFDAKDAVDCPSPPSYLLDYTGLYQHRFTIQVSLNGKDTLAMLDTGDDDYVTVHSDDASLRSSDDSGLMRIDTVNGPVTTKFYEGKTRIEAGGRKVVAQTTILPADGSLVPYMLGSGVLLDFDALIDTKRHRACLISPQP